MIHRIRIVPVEPMARRLAAYPAADRATPSAAALILRRECYLPDDISVGLDAAMEEAARLALAAASDHPVARGLAIVRDVVSCVAIIACVALWAMPA